MEYNLTHWYGTTTEKILAWRELRQQSIDKSIEYVVQSVNSWWAYSLWVKKTIDPYMPSSWPSPWELINKGEFCRSAIALGQAYTLWLCIPDNKVELWLINNFSENDIHLVVVIDEKYMLNYTLGQVLNIEECQYEVLSTVTKNDLPHIKI